MDNWDGRYHSASLEVGLLIDFLQRFDLGKNRRGEAIDIVQELGLFQIGSAQKIREKRGSRSESHLGQSSFSALTAAL